MRLAFGGNKGDFSFAHSSNRATCGKYIVERWKREKEIEILVVRLHLRAGVLKNVTLRSNQKITSLFGLLLLGSI